MAILGPENAYIFRITHIDNIAWILDHGLHCKSSNVNDPKFVPIGMADLIQKRTSRQVPVGPGGTLSDYVPFYFTPWSVMMYNIRTGYNHVTKRRNEEIVILVSSLHSIQSAGSQFVFTNGHAYLQESDFFNDLTCLDRIDWDLLRSKDFKRNPEDPGKLGRYQAEALIHSNVPLQALLGIACYDSQSSQRLEGEVLSRNLSIKTKLVPSWYF